MMEISIVIPVYNSAPLLADLCAQLLDVLKEKKIEIILVDDGSHDESWNIIKLCSENPEVVGISLMRNFGQDNAIMAGLNRSTGKYVVIMDDDLQHSPRDIDRLYKQIKLGYDVCYANYGADKKQSWWKNLGSYLNAKQAELLIDKPREIYLSPFKILHHTVVDSMITYTQPYPYIDGLIFRATTNITQVKVCHHERKLGEGNYNLRRSLSVFFKHSTGFSVIPLRVASLFGVFIAFLGFLLGIIYIYKYFSSDVVEGWTTLVSLILFIGGMILVSLGIIGEYLGRMYQAVNHRPQFIIRKIAK